MTQEELRNELIKRTKREKQVYIANTCGYDIPFYDDTFGHGTKMRIITF